jgi:hypothetical protein
MNGAHAKELRLCAWCSAICTGRDESGDPACADHASELAAERAPVRVIRIEDAPRDRNREIHNFVIGEFRSNGAIV